MMPTLYFFIGQYLRLLESRREYPGAVALDALADQARQLERAVGPVTIAFGHNDLLAANLIDDGQVGAVGLDEAGEGVRVAGQSADGQAGFGEKPLQSLAQQR